MTNGDFAHFTVSYRNAALNNILHREPRLPHQLRRHHHLPVGIQKKTRRRIRFTVPLRMGEGVRGELECDAPEDVTEEKAEWAMLTSMRTNIPEGDVNPSIELAFE